MEYQLPVMLRKSLLPMRCHDNKEKELKISRTYFSIAGKNMSYSKPTISCLNELNNTDAIQNEWRLIVNQENARKFLKDAADDIDLRNRFNEVRNSEEFIKIAAELGYVFTTENLLTVVKEQSQLVTERRDGVWQWLRSVNWVEKYKIHNPPITLVYQAEQAQKFVHLQVDVELLLQQMLDLKRQSLVELERVLAKGLK
jgi:predicted ribosomally synthesized peptide with nif11-like leader